jgi:hypothetical protein
MPLMIANSIAISPPPKSSNRHSSEQNVLNGIRRAMEESMTGPEHYLKAEEILAPLDGKERGTYPEEDRVVAEAQVHAILALAAATALGTSEADNRAWIDAAGSA